MQQLLVTCTQNPRQCLHKLVGESLISLLCMCDPGRLIATHTDFESGGGVGGLAAAISLRRAGHKVTIYERAHFAGEVGASISCAANGTQWLHEWGVNVPEGDPVILRKLINRDWKTGAETNVYDLADYEERWGHVYNMFHRQYMHSMLMNTATGAGKGTPAKLVVDHKCQAINLETGLITFENGNTATHEVVIGADGIGVSVSSARTVPLV